jgi:hypothetical protein
MDAIRDIERTLSQGNGALGCKPFELGEKLDPYKDDNHEAVGKLFQKISTLAFACDLTRVASFEISTALNRIRYPWVDSLGEGHALSHSGASDADAKAQLLSRQNWHSSLIARLFDRLAIVGEGEGSVLDSTLLFWGNEVSMGTTHTHDNMPFLVAGGGWAFRTGRYVQYTDTTKNLHGDLLISILNAMGVPDTTFGDARYCTGPLSGLV